MEYTRGFHPRPRATFREPLGLGFQSVGEWANYRVVSGIPDIDELNRVSVEGIRFLAVLPLKNLGRRQSKILPSYVICLPGLERTVSMDGWECTPIRDGLVMVSQKEHRPPQSIEELVSTLAGKKVSRYNIVRLYDNPYSLDWRGNAEAFDLVVDSIFACRGGSSPVLDSGPGPKQ